MSAGTLKMLLFDTSEELDVTLVEWNALYRVVDWKKFVIAPGCNDGSTRAEILRWALNELRTCVRNELKERLDWLESCLKSAAKASTATSYVKLIALRGLQRAHVLLRPHILLEELS